MPAVSGPTQVAVGTTAVLCTFSAQVKEGVLVCQDADDAGVVYYSGDSGLTTSNGFKIPKDAANNALLVPASALAPGGWGANGLYFRSGTAAQTIYLMPV